MRGKRRDADEKFAARTRLQKLFAQTRERELGRVRVRAGEVDEQRRRAVEGDRVNAPQVELQKAVRGDERAFAPAFVSTLAFAFTFASAFVFACALAFTLDFAFALAFDFTHDASRLDESQRAPHATTLVRADGVEKKKKVVYLGALVGDRGRRSAPGFDAPE